MYVSRDREFFFPMDIIEQASKLGISHERLKHMVRHSTRVTHPLGNRRFDDCLFMVEGDRVTAFGNVKDKVLDQPARGAQACQHCDRGLVRSTIPCPECKGQDANCPSCRGSGRVITFDECEHCEGKGTVV